ncbi:uncharacterized protein LOC103705971 isoform X2 [Phoenix dactylifera]|uniref:Uncharacterized protein LOC103705971 isoform X2 n=1 Tax=Phoenix dactylifera TaxID=42345 RepID=A0A8B8J3R8_PHODC|nr:uncharacterized protein LOC103705971 isoform X2 [Phoenix dactylifera]
MAFPSLYIGPLPLCLRWRRAADLTRFRRPAPSFFSPSCGDIFSSPSSETRSSQRETLAPILTASAGLDPEASHGVEAYLEGTQGFAEGSSYLLQCRNCSHLFSSILGRKGHKLSFQESRGMNNHLDSCKKRVCKILMKGASLT